MISSAIFIGITRVNFAVGVDVIAHPKANHKANIASIKSINAALKVGDFDKAVKQALYLTTMER